MMRKDLKMGRYALKMLLPFFICFFMLRLSFFISQIHKQKVTELGRENYIGRDSDGVYNWPQNRLQKGSDLTGQQHTQQNLTQVPHPPSHTRHPQTCPQVELRKPNSERENVCDVQRSSNCAGRRRTTFATAYMNTGSCVMNGADASSQVTPQAELETAENCKMKVRKI